MEGREPVGVLGTVKVAAAAASGRSTATVPLQSRAPSRVRLGLLILGAWLVPTGSLVGQDREVRPSPLTFAGDTVTQRTGTLKGFETADYALSARAGQWLRVRVRSSRETWLVVRVFPSARSVGADILNTFTTGLVGGEARIPGDGAYTVRVAIHRVEARRGGEAEYALTVALSDPVGEEEPGSHDAPREWTEEGACPFECCTYGNVWTLRESFALRAASDPYAATYRDLPLGARVTGLTGRTRTRAGRFRYTRASGPFDQGEAVDVYDYLGEGRYRVWHDGAMTEADLATSPYGASTESPLGSMEVVPRQAWWVNVLLVGGEDGWIEVPDPTVVGGADACAAGM